MEDDHLKTSQNRSFHNFSTIIFDFDYTLVDSSKGVFESINFALHELGLPEAKPEAINKTIGLSLEETFLTLAGQQRLTEYEKFRHLFIRRADEVMADLTIMYTSVPHVVKELRNYGCTLAIFSSKFRYRIEAILKRENLFSLFDIIIGWEDVSKPKPDPDGLLEKICRNLQVPPAKALYVGDTITDAETARRAGISFVAVLSGVTSREDFSNYPIYSVIENVSELPQLIVKYKII
jgi:phosphoglycolate phosphatase